MIKYISSLILISLSGSFASGQIVRTYGMKIGGCSATQTWEDDSQTIQGTHFRWGVDVGAFIEWFHLPIFSLSSEIHYVQKGLRYDIPVTSEQFPNGTGEFISLTPNLNYLSVPLLGKLRLDLSQAELYVVLGPRFDFVLSSDGDNLFASQFNQFNSFEFGGEFGVGIQTRALFNLATGVEFKFSPSFGEGYSDDLITMTNRSFELLLTIGK